MQLYYRKINTALITTNFLQVRLIDVGCVLVVDVNQLLSLPEKFLKIPYQVIEVYMCGLKPCDQDLDWPVEVCSA